MQASLRSATIGLILAFAPAVTAQTTERGRELAIEAMTAGAQGPLQVEVSLASLDPEAVEVLLRVEGDLPPAVPMMLTACFAFLEIGDRCLDPVPVATPSTPGAPWEGHLIVDLPDEPVAIGVLVELVGTDESPDRPVEAELFGTGATDAATEGLVRLASPELLDLRQPTSTESEPAAVGDRPVRLIPPPGGTLTGTHRFRVLASDPRVEKVIFQLDGEQVASDGSHPYSARIDLGREADERTVLVIGYDDSDVELGRDEAIVNERRVSNRIRLAGRESTDGALIVEAEIALATGIEVERVVVSYRGRTVADLERAPYRASIDIADASPSDYVQAVATLSDGSTIEDVLLLTAGGVGERIEVHLTELYTVFFDRETGAVLDEFDADGVRLSIQGRPHAIERFAPADERPITVGLVIDTSSSMYALIPDTQRAAGRFLSGVLRPGDRAFLVDFDTRPRLAHAASEDRHSLISRLAVLTADGFTALFDSIVYSTLEFPADGRRRALVVLTDGDDYRGKLGPDNAIEYAQAAGAPVYILSLAGIHMSYQAFGRLKDDIKPVSKPDIEKVAKQTGGRVFYITDPDELPAAYDRILKELTNQYLVTFSTPQELTDSQRAGIRLEPVDQEVELRFTVGRPEE